MQEGVGSVLWSRPGFMLGPRAGLEGGCCCCCDEAGCCWVAQGEVCVCVFVCVCVRVSASPRTGLLLSLSLARSRSLSPALPSLPPLNY